MKLTPNQEIIKKDIMRYKNNKLPASLALLGIVFSCLYFCLLYGFRSAFFSEWKIGMSVVLSLIVLLTAFLSSEGIKNYKKTYCIVLLVLAVVMIVRIFILPLSALTHDSKVVAGGEYALETRYFGIDLTPAACFVILTLWLCASAACFIASAVIGYINCKKLEDYKAKIESNEIDLNKVLKEEDDAEQSAETAAVVAEAVSEEVENA